MAYLVGFKKAICRPFQKAGISLLSCRYWVKSMVSSRRLQAASSGRSPEQRVHPERKEIPVRLRILAAMRRGFVSNRKFLIWYGKTMADFRADVARELATAETAGKEEPDMSKEDVAQAVQEAVSADRKARTYATVERCRTGQGPQ